MMVMAVMVGKRKVLNSGGRSFQRRGDGSVGELEMRIVPRVEVYVHCAGNSNNMIR